MRIRKTTVALFLLFLSVMAVWYLGGYPQLAHKETPVFLYENYLGLPVDMAYSLNALSKFLGCIAVASLLTQKKVSMKPPEGLSNF